MTGVAYVFLGVLTALMVPAYRDHDTDGWDRLGLIVFLLLTGVFVGRGIEVLV
jgi:hypothetical protein